MTGRKLLHVACEHGHLDVVKWLVDLDVTLDPQDRRSKFLACFVEWGDDLVGSSSNMLPQHVSPGETPLSLA
eukprot:1220994-Amorphochlora_amoeboformis.AAC.1